MKWPKNYLNIAQGSPEWFHERCGAVTASRIAAVVTRLKNGKESAARQNYKLELLTEILTGRTVEHYVSAAMDFGTENEPLARTEYELTEDVQVERIGYVLHPRIKRTGASPDGLIGKDGMVEIKVPQTATHLEYFLAGVVPDEYRPQMMRQLACAEREWCDFCSYDPRVPQEFSLLVVRLERDDTVIAQMEAEVEQFIGELNAMSQTLLKNKRVIVGPAPQKAEIPDLTWLR